LSKRQIARVQGLLPMEYRPSELARAVGCNVNTIYTSWVPAGCPHRRDDNRHIWIVGTEFAAWARNTVYHSTIELAPEEAYCLRCRAPVRMRGPVRRRAMKRAVLVSARCPQCGSDVAKFTSPTEGAR
jgi:uncharacterized protein with PIN domain